MTGNFLKLGRDDLLKLIAQARAIAEFRPPKEKEATSEQQQQIIELLGLRSAEENVRPAKKRRKQK